MRFTQYYLDCLSQASYLVADDVTGKAVVVDPRRDVEEYLDDARANKGIREYLQLRDGPFQPEPFGPRSKKKA